MIPPPLPEQPSLDPRQVLRAGGKPALAECLAQTGYRIQQGLLDDFEQVLLSGKIWLIEGAPGAGKSAVAYATQRGCNMTLFPVQGMSELTLADLLYQWDREAQNQFIVQAVATGGMTLAEAQREQYALRFLKLGRALHAFHWAATSDTVPLFFFDEVDKLPEYLQDMLLGLLECGYAYVPGYDAPLGVYDAETGLSDRARWPLVIFTSNNLRCKLSPPFRSRCFYSWLDQPTPREEVHILRARVPEAAPHQVRAVARFNEAIKAIPGVSDKPGLRELIDLLGALVRDDVHSFGGEVLGRYVGYLAKQQSQSRSLRLALARVAREIEQRDDLLDGWLAEAFGRERIYLAQAA
jgi:MoxR-like ATPase